MNDQVVVSKNGQLCIAIPLFRINDSHVLDQYGGYKVVITKGNPLGFIIDCESK